MRQDRRDDPIAIVFALPVSARWHPSWRQENMFVNCCVICVSRLDVDRYDDLCYTVGGIEHLQERKGKAVSDE